VATRLIRAVLGGDTEGAVSLFQQHGVAEMRSARLSQLRRQAVGTSTDILYVNGE
jgi:hypothetical protein